jgi:hypothetical protein
MSASRTTACLMAWHTFRSALEGQRGVVPRGAATVSASTKKAGVKQQREQIRLVLDRQSSI